MSSIKKQARRAGILYLPSRFSLVDVPRALVVSADATATANHLRASQSLIRASIASELIISTFLILAVLAFYHLFKRISEATAALC
jgi:hypothetical protein